ncbi:MAG TPA: type I 3-dehydroquinate dehydratase [Bacteroidales bacterium]|nr:type I 3-dehydroquinate dehydratase [Bacteroidales bacterium]
MICVSIPVSNTDECLELIQSAAMAEIRIDMAGFDMTAVAHVFSSAKKPLIATCRPEIVADNDRVKLLIHAIQHGAAYVDIEYEASPAIQQKIIAEAKKYTCKVIISYHNYSTTPSTKELHTIIDSCFNAGADIAKIATTALTPNDSARILGLYDSYTNLVALAMGKLGAITRIANCYLGSPFTFAAINQEQKTAPGQFTVEEMKLFYSI